MKPRGLQVPGGEKATGKGADLAGGFDGSPDGGALLLQCISTVCFLGVLSFSTSGSESFAFLELCNKNIKDAGRSVNLVRLAVVFCVAVRHDQFSPWVKL